MVISAYATLEELAFDIFTRLGATYFMPIHWRAPLLKVQICVSSCFASAPSQRAGLNDLASEPQIWVSLCIVYADIPTSVYMC